jgi:lysophospholipase L1-like esterase
VSVVDNASTCPAVLERLLANDFRPAGWERVEVLNLGVGGYTSHEVLLTLEHYALPLKPDVVLFQCGFNDVAPRFFANFTADYSHFRKSYAPLEVGLPARIAYRSRFVVVLGWKLGWLGPITLQSRTQYPLPPAPEAVANLEKNGPEAYRHNLEEAVERAKGSGARVWLITEAHFFSPVFQAPDENTRLLDEAYRRGLAEHNEVTRSVAKQSAVGLIDLERTMPLSLKSFADPIHMTEAGDVIKARLIAERMAGTLSQPALAE